IHQLFEEQVQRTPDATAVVFESEQLTYQQLNARANQLAHYLSRQGVGPESLVGICLERSIEMVVALLGILKAGAAYLPLDPSYPLQRITFMLEDAGVCWLLTDAKIQETLAVSAPIISMDKDWVNISCEETSLLSVAVTDSNLAYIIYTSGSTGIPKGVAISHHSCVVLLHWAQDIFSTTELQGVLAATSICFDLSIFEIFVPLSCGGKVILAQNALQLGEMATREQVTLINTVPSAMAELVRIGAIGDSVKVVNLAGEPLSQKLVEQVYEASRVARVMNLYGPTEDTTYTTYTMVAREEKATVTIGRPIANTQIYIMDREMETVPVGVPGELHIGGVGLARGYLNRPELTAEKFIPNPYSSEAGARLYRTGDLARYLSDGNIEYLGRIDNQVKVRGYRIELGEIETTLRQYRGVSESVVIAAQEKLTDKRLVAYLVVEQDNEIDIGQLRVYLKEKLPEYMLPSAFVMLEKLPLTPNGKVDRRALPAPQMADIVNSERYLAARNPTEEILVEIWTSILNNDQIGVLDNFFELGGHSLLAIQVISRVRAVFSLELPLRSLFETPTVAGLAEQIQILKRTEQGLLVPPIMPITREQKLPLSFAQQRLWFLNQLEPNSTAYNISTALQLKGNIQLSALEYSFNEIIQRHESLRTTFKNIDGQPYQVISPNQYFKLEVDDLTHLPKSTREAEARRLAIVITQRSFNLETGPLFNIELLRLDEQDHVLVLSMHHIITDGWSMGILMEEWTECYKAYCEGKQVLLSNLIIQYADFAYWQREWLQGEVLIQELSYWKRQLGGSLPVLQLPTDRPRPAVQSHRGARRSLTLSQDLSMELNKLSQHQNVTLFMTLLAAFKTLLFHYTGQTDIIVGTPIANRNQVAIERVIGFFINTLALRTNLSGRLNFVQLLQRVKEVCLEAYTNQDLPFEKIVEELQPERSLNHTPIFQVMFNMLNQTSQTSESLELFGLTAQELLPIEVGSKFDLNLYVSNKSEHINLTLVYSTDLFDEVTIYRLLKHFQQLLQCIVTDPEQQLINLPIISIEEQQRRLQGNLIGPTTSFVQFHREEIKQSVAARFQQQVEKYPNNIAIETAHLKWSYRELNTRADSIAQAILPLREQGQQRIALLFDHDAPMIAALMGVIKAGIVYVPLDPSYPRERISYIIDDIEVRTILTDSKNLSIAAQFAVNGIEVINIDCLDDVEPTSKVDLPIAPDAMAYILYTSGSTGQPKGVMQNHRNVLHHIRNYTNRLHICSQDRLTLLSSYSFDAAVMDIFGALLNGATLYPVNIREEGLTGLAQWMINHGITIYHSTPTVYRYFVNTLQGTEEFPQLRLIVLGGEEVFRKDVEQYKNYFSPQCLFVNGFGPTESTVTMQYFINKEAEIIHSSVPIGYPVEDTEILLLNEDSQEIVLYGIGEIVIKSAHIALGYWQKPELTEQVFLKDTNDESKRYYHTGDLGRYRPDGSIGYIRRKDLQVKIRGHRVEIPEIEVRLQEHTGIQEVVVIAREDERGEKQLVVFYVAKQQHTLAASELRSFLRERLPEYMIPTTYVAVSALPLTPTNKIDRQALLNLDQSLLRMEEEQISPRNVAEEILTAIWTEILKLEQINIHDNFFDLGGHSLLATQLISRVRNTFKIELPLRSLFEQPTVAGMAAKIEMFSQESIGNVVAPIVPVTREQNLPLSFSQQRLWFLDQFEPGNPTYNMFAAVRLKGVLNITVLTHSINEIVQRHESLRTQFININGQPQQHILTGSEVSLSIINLTILSEQQLETEIQHIIREQTQQSFQLAQGPLLRASLIYINEAEYILIVVLHHIICDGWSIGVFINELTTFYSAYIQNRRSPLPKLAVQYADYAVWQREWLHGEVLEQQLHYWRQQLGSEQEVLALPTDRPRPAVQSHRGGHYRFRLSEELTRGLKELSRQANATLFMTLLSAFDVLLYRYTNQTSISVGTPIANRNRTEIEGLIGFFVNTLVMRVELSGKLSFAQLLERVREVALSAYAHQDVPFEKVVEELQLERDLSRSPLFQVMLVLQNAPTSRLTLTDLTISPISIENRTAKFDLNLVLTETETGLLGSWEYCLDLFDESTVTRMVGHFTRLLTAVVENVEQPLWQLPLLSESECQQLLIEWNDT
ncbi:MAG: amino acid adenylation domain-containing protein, partial [Acidobacteriota bacterium]